MSPDTTPRDSDARYGTIETIDDSLIVFDQDNERAWVQSDYTVPVGGHSVGPPRPSESGTG